MATLYRARRHGAAGFARDVAIKVVHPHLAADATFLRMFADEANLAVRIHHPNVVQVEELGAEAGNLYLVMELVRGCALSELLDALLERGMRLPPVEAVRLAIQVAEGLHAAHETRDDHGVLLGVVHRDVSPQNVLVSQNGYAKLIDFGIAKAMGRKRTLTGTVKGKLAYMAPEQASGLEVDRRSDVYALGVVLWELLTMRPLFDGASTGELLDHVRNPLIEPPSRHAPDVLPELDRAVLCALSPRPDDRPATADDFRGLLCAAVPDASTQGARCLEELLTNLAPIQAADAPVSEASLAAAARAFRVPDLTTVPRERAHRALTPPGRMPRPSKPFAVKAPRMRLTAGIVALCVVAFGAGSLVKSDALRVETPTPGTASAPSGAPSLQRSEATEPLKGPLSLPRGLDTTPRQQSVMDRVEGQPSLGPDSRRVETAKAHQAKAAVPARPRGRRPNPPAPASKVIDGVIVLDEALY